jgi:hypothetical protein
VHDPSSLVPAATWLRVSTTEQESSNQISDVERFCACESAIDPGQHDVGDEADYPSGSMVTPPCRGGQALAPKPIGASATAIGISGR